MQFNDFARDYLAKLKESIDLLPIDTLRDITQLLHDAYRDGKQVIVMGNGGSASNSSHFVCDLAKGTIVADKPRFRAIGLTDNTPLATACANDYGYENVFKEQIDNLVQEGDVVIAISGSGNSINVLKAVELANSRAATSVALTGMDGGRLAQLANVSLTVPSENMERVEDLHLVLTHIMKSYLKMLIENDLAVS